MRFRLTTWVWMLWIPACAVSEGKRAAWTEADFPPVTRAEALEIGRGYTTLRWLPTERNVRHGRDRRGVLVDTPDVSYQKPGAVPGWWVPGQWNTGMPYQWGGFSSPQEFLEGIAQGRAAGDVYTTEKRRQLEAAVSREAVGVDCSGFVSRCWKLPRAYSTRELASLCDRLPSWNDLRPGDLLNTYNVHCLLFVRWVDPMRTKVRVLESGTLGVWGTVEREHEVGKLISFGYQALRYRKMRD
ncbi:MAG: hypothetical protein KDK99_07440 [Verrucomicrobiales bacterium]|nr:hypothetical protein [Verrucomicrobiales bacterium]